VNQRYDSREYKQMKLLRERMDTLEGEIAKAQEMLGGGLAREARKAGAPPGWVRRSIDRQVPLPSFFTGDAGPAPRRSAAAGPRLARPRGIR
jgi:hypothetical protein